MRAVSAVVAMVALLATAPGALADAAADLAARYAPVAMMRTQAKPCDRSGDVYDPSAVETVLGNPQVTLRRLGGDERIVAPTSADLAGKDEAWYLDFPGNPKRPGCTYDAWYRASRGDLPAVAYAHVAGEPGKRGLAVQYWLFYPFNQWNNTHESDWEMVQVVFAASTPEEALGEEPLAVGYAQHDNGESAAWDDAKLTRQGTHPVVYVSAGSHASYFEPKVYVGRGDGGAGFGCDHADGPRRAVDLEARAIPADPRADPAWGWATFEGHWGERASAFYDGPRGPNTGRKWREPLTWQEGLRDGNVAVPGTSFVGPSATGVFCGAVAAGSQTVLAAQSNPLLVLGALGVLVLAILGWTRATAWRPVEVAPIVRRRAGGQLLRAAWRTYRSAPSLFLGIGLVFLPAAMLAGGIQALAVEQGPLASLLSVLGRTTFGLGLAVTIGALPIIVAYLLAHVATIAALARVDRGEEATPLLAYRDAASRVRDLLWPRFRSLVPVVILALTIVGLPLAALVLVRSQFIEQAVLLGGASRRNASRAAADVVAGAWLRALGLGVVLGGGVILVGGLGCALLMLLVRSLPLSVVNAIAALVFVALVPYVSILVTLLWGDLVARRQASPEPAPPAEPAASAA